MRFVEFVTVAVKAAFCTFVLLGVLLAGGLGYIRSMTFQLDLTLDVFDGVYFVVVLPILVGLVTLLLSPLSYWLFRWVNSSKPKGTKPEADTAPPPLPSAADST